MKRAGPVVRGSAKSTLKGKRNDYEYRVIERLHACLAPDVEITVLADRGFGDQKLYALLQTLGWDFIIRFRGLIQVEAADGERKPAKLSLVASRAAIASTFQLNRSPTSPSATSSGWKPRRASCATSRRSVRA